MLWLSLLSFASTAAAQSAGSIVDVGDTKVSAMMMFVGNEEKLYILDKVENNAAQIDGHPAWGVEWNLPTDTAKLLPLTTNTFCAAGMHLPNGTWATFGGNMAVGPSCDPPHECESDATYGDDDGATAVRLLTPCTDADGDNCEWLDNNSLNLQTRRWYPGAECLSDGSVVLIGGFVNGGYINRNVPNNDPATEGGGANPTYEFWPSRGDPQQMQFMLTTSGLNSYAHAYLMPSGNMFVQANWSTIMWDYNKNVETPLPDMPNHVVRVYPGSGAVAMLPLTPDNNYEPTILFCGGQDMPEEDWGNYVQPAVNTFDVPASQDCQRITPEPQDGSDPAYVQDDNLIEPRTMGQFILLPDETILIVNGAHNGTAGYATGTGQTANFADMPFGMSLSADPVFTPAIYTPTAPAGSRWSNMGLSASKIPRLYHSSAILLPDTSVMIAGSNPNVDVNLSTIYPTTYRAERLYPAYFSASVRPAPSGIPATLTYGGTPFDITIPSSSFTGNANTAAANTKIVVIRPGFSTHAMNMGQKLLRLNSTYTVGDDGTITMHVSQMPPNANLYQPGPAFMHVVIAGIPSNGTLVTVGNGKLGTQAILQVTPLPPSQNSTKVAITSGSPQPTTSAGGGSSGRGESFDVRIAAVVSGLVGVVGIAMGL